MSDGRLTRMADYLVGLVSPRQAVLRKHFRKLENDPEYRSGWDLMLQVRGYKAAGHSKNHTPWQHSSNRSADAEINPDLWTMRNRSRAASRDDALSSGIIRTLVRGVVGTGLRPQARTGDDTKDSAIESVWAARAPQLDQGNGNLIHGSHQAMVYGKQIEDGDVFLRPAVTHPGEPIWIEVIEADRVRTPADAMPLDDKGRIINGVEKDGFGRTVAYWILQKHPGDWVLWDTKLGKHAHPFPSTFSKKYFDRVDAASVCHARSRVTRPGQTRGVPTCHAIMQDLRDLDLLILAALKRTQVAACLGAFIKSPLATTDLMQVTAEDFGYQLNDKLEPGMLFRLFPGEEVQFLNPTAGVPDLGEFVYLLARRIGAAIGLSPETIMRDWRETNYSAARTVKIDDRQTYRVERADFAGHVLSWEWRIVMEDELLRGNEQLLQAGVEFEDLRHVEWIGDEEQWVDPQAEVAATQIMLQLQLTSPQIECARLGRDYPTVLRECLEAQAMESEIRAELGLPERVDPNAPQADVQIEGQSQDDSLTAKPTKASGKGKKGKGSPLKLLKGKKPSTEENEAMVPATVEFDDLGAGKPLDVATYGQPGKGAVA